MAGQATAANGRRPGLPQSTTFYGHSPGRLHARFDMLDQAYARLLLIVAALAGAHSVHEPSSAAAQDARAPVTTAVPAADAQTTAIIDAANAFLATLSGEQKTAVLFDFANLEQRVRWSNLPEGIFKRT